ncbi:MAG: hypothetical protein LBT84_06270, partial [Spirochaetia bacterium]|nr:hypothetical protein [Spirochaetia bacterium]
LLLGGTEAGAAAPMELDRQLLQQAVKAADLVLIKGIISADETNIESARQLSLKLEGSGIGNLARLLWSLASDIENMLAKNADFNQNRCFSTLSRIRITSSLLLKDTGGKTADKLIEKSRSVYRALPYGDFVGLGAYPWHTRSGFAGVTALVYHKEKKRIATYSVNMADFYDSTKDAGGMQNIKSLYNRENHWDASISIRHISEAVFTLKNYKINDDGRISSSKGTTFFYKEKTSADSLYQLTLFHNDDYRYNYFKKKRSAEYELICSENITDCLYNEAGQVLHFTFETKNGNIPGLIPWAGLNMSAINYIEELAENGSRESMWFLCRREMRGFVPLSMIGQNGVENFYFA